MVCDGNGVSDYNSESKCAGTLSQKSRHPYPLSFFGGWKVLILVVFLSGICMREFLLLRVLE